MSLVATVVNPLTEPVPPQWDRFVADQRLLPVWHPELVRTADWCTQNTSSMVLVSQSSDACPVAVFHARHLGPTSPRRFARPHRVAPVSMTEVRSVPVLDSGVAFATGTDQRDRAEAVRVFERALRTRVGPGGRFIAYRGLAPADLAVVPTTARMRMELSPRMVVHNQWSDRDSYLASLPKKWRSHLRKIRRTLDRAGTVRAGFEQRIEPDQAAWMSHLVRARHQPRGMVRPPLPARYFEVLNELPDAHYVTYRDAAGRLIAFCSVYDTGVEIRPGVWGLRAEADGGQRNLYFDQYLRMVELMIERQRSQLILGPGMGEIKTRYGATPEPRWAVAGLR